jgi:hypothetical protein
MGKTKQRAKKGKHLLAPPSLTEKSFTDQVEGTDGLYVDPAQIRFQHSRIRPFFSGCGRSVEGTLEEIRNGTTQVSDLPPIQVLVGPHDDETDATWYFSLNNRRLWVLKRLREEGLLEQYGNKVLVRVRTPKSLQEQERYSLKNCALDAKIVPEKATKSKNKKKKRDTLNDHHVASIDSNCIETKEGRESVLDGQTYESKLSGLEVLTADLGSASSEENESDDEDEEPLSNRFGALLMD